MQLKGEKQMKILKKVLTIIVMIILCGILFASGVILVNSYIKPNEVPSFFGWKPFIVLSGSMETQIMTGDIAVVKEIDTNNLKENDIIAFKDNEDIIITHRIVEIIREDDGKVKYKTKGDNNNIEDDGYVYPEQVEGIYKFRVGKLGNLSLFIQTPVGMVVCISIPLIMLLLIQWVDSAKEKKYKSSREQEIEDLKKQNEELRKNK